MKYYVELPEKNRESVSRLVQERAISNGWKVKIELSFGSSILLFGYAMENRIDACMKGFCLMNFKQILWKDAITKGVPAPEVDYSKWVGLPCWFWDNLDPSMKVFAFFDKKDCERFYSKNINGQPGCCWHNCKLATKEELQGWMDKLQSAQ